MSGRMRSCLARVGFLLPPLGCSVVLFGGMWTLIECAEWSSRRELAEKQRTCFYELDMNYQTTVLAISLDGKFVCQVAGGKVNIYERTNHPTQWIRTARDIHSPEQAMVVAFEDMHMTEVSGQSPKFTFTEVRTAGHRYKVELITTFWKSLGEMESNGDCRKWECGVVTVQ